MLKLIVALVAVAAIAGGTAAGIYYLTQDGDEKSVTQSPQGTAAPSGSPTPMATVAATPTPLPDGWQIYLDRELKFSFPHPQGLTVSVEHSDLPERNGNPRVRFRTMTFSDAEGVPALSLTIVPNPNDLTVEEWVTTYRGRPSEPQAVTIGGEQGLLFPIDTMGEQSPHVYFRHRRFVYDLAANVHGSEERGHPPVLSEADFQRVVDGFRFSQ
ncbi:MAG: hypothetical protein ACE5KW_02915 [Dehalococcoidia bacterium]